jgi:hypothetical protein
MNSKGRILAACSGNPVDHVPLTTWSFGVKAPPGLRWRNSKGDEIVHWYTSRLEHIHTLPQPWDLEDDFKRAAAWLSLGIDDVLDISVPWSTAPGVTWQDTVANEGHPPSPAAVRDYQTPSGTLRHIVRLTGEESGQGWPIQPGKAVLFEDMNIPRAVKQLISRPEEIPAIRHLYRAPDRPARDWFAARMDLMQTFAETHGVAVQAWSAFGMDAAVWMAGAVGAVMMAIDEPQAFGHLMDIIAECDYGRTELAAAHPGVDIIAQRGWYSSTDFWSPKLFNQFVFPHLKELCALAHRNGKKFAYVMTTGVEKLGPRLAEAGVDVLYFVDPLQDHLSLETTRDLLGGQMTLVGGINVLTLGRSDKNAITDGVQRAMDTLGPTGRFILHPVDSLFPDTPWGGIEIMITAWKSYCS